MEETERGCGFASGPAGAPVVCLLAIWASVHGPLPSAGGAMPVIPGAAGFGMDTPAGSGRHLDEANTRIIKVTTLNPAGPGSLRAALEAEGPRVVVFEVGGNIDFRPMGHLQIRHPYCTVAGQTAPSPGITLVGCELGIGTHDVLLQHIRIRVGDLRDPTRPVKNKAGWTQWSERDCMKVSGRRIVIDHCSFSWATDENVQSRARDVTFRHNIFSEALSSDAHHKGQHSKSLLILNQGPGDRVVPDEQMEGQYVAVIGNLFAHQKDRCPAAAQGTKIVVANNLIYNTARPPGIAMTFSNSPRRGSRGGPSLVSAVGNVIDRTPVLVRVIARNGPVGKIHLADCVAMYTNKEGKLVTEHVPDLWAMQRRAGQDPNRPYTKIFTSWCGETIHPQRSRAAEPPVAVPGLTIRPGGEVREWVLARAGARPAERDPVDARVIRSVRQRTGKVIASQSDVGGWPDLPPTRRTLDIPAAPHADDDADGYTNLEEWLHAHAASVERKGR